MAVVITGGTGAIGSAIVKAFAKNNDVAVIYRSADEKAEELAKETGCKCYKADITSREQVNDVTKQILSDFGKVDVIVNNAGISQIKMFCDITELDWYNMIDVHLTGAFNVTQSLLPSLVSRKKGSIINVSSVWGVHGASCEVHYSTVKAGLIGFTKALAKELAPSGITVNCVAPGVIDSPMNNQHLSDADLKELIEQTPVGRLGTPDDVAKAVMYLSEADFVTGQVIGIDGGFY
ncbi:MAG: SDR family oxidoreductase [Ruminococcaceae bacterium]|nr:SDR family oxidoreductase [Oscillospiraceae bacterium]